MRKIFVYLLVVISVLMIAGCGSDDTDNKQVKDEEIENKKVLEDEETAVEEDEEEKTDEAETEQNVPEEEPVWEDMTSPDEDLQETTDVIIDDTNVFFAEYGKKYRADLDGDGTEEEIIAEKVNYNVDVTIDGTVYSEVFIYTNTYMSDYYCFVDLDRSDSILHVALQDYGPSSDEMMVFYAYNGSDFEDIGMMTGVFDKGYGFKDAVCNGEGVINSYIRFRIFQTWFGNADYVLEDGRLILDTHNIHEALDRFKSKHTLIVDLTAYKDADVSSETVTLPEGTVFTAVASDNKEWVKIKTEDEQDLWIRFKKAEYEGDVDDELAYYYAFTGTVYVDGEKTLDCYEIFEGLIIAG